MADGLGENLAADTPQPPFIVVVDDHQLLAQMLVDHLVANGFLAAALDHTEIDLARRIEQLHPDLVLLDAVFAGDEDGGMRVLEALREGTALPVAILTGVTDDLRHAEFLAAGASAVIAKADSFDGVVAQISDVVAGIDPMGAARRQRLAQRLQDRFDAHAAQQAPLQELTPGEITTLQALVDGRTVEEIADRRTVAVSTVRSHVRSLLRKLDAHSQIEAVAIAARAGMRPAEPSPEP